MGNYEVDSKILSSAISRCLGVIALGDKAESNSITLDFGKKGLTVEAVNSVASYRTEIPVEIVKPAKMRAHILPELLLAYSNSHKSLTLIPTEQHLMVKGGKSFSAEMYFVGENDTVKMVKPEDATDISAIALASQMSLGLIGGIRNRTDDKVLGVMMEWEKNQLEITIGDTHHAVMIDQVVKAKAPGKIIMTLPNLQKIMSVGENFASEENKIYAWSESDYLSIMGQSENVFLSNSAREVVKTGKRLTRVVLETEEFRNIMDTMVNAVEESNPITFKLSAKNILATLKTGASNAKGSIKVKKFSGKEITIAVSIHHLKDCMSTMKEDSMAITVYSNMVTLESSNKKLKTIAAMSSVAPK